MTDAKTLLLDLLAVIPNGRKCAALFAEDGVLELPYLHSLGIPARHQGREAIANFFDFVGGTLFSGFGFSPENVTVLIDTKDQVFAEYLTDARAAATGRLIHHLFAGRLVAEGGAVRSVWKAVAKHREPALRPVARGLVLDHVPMFGELAVFDANYVDHDPGYRGAES